jgi:hypothetical protein
LPHCRVLVLNTHFAPEGETQCPVAGSFSLASLATWRFTSVFIGRSAKEWLNGC